ncbi:hypothetical protein PSPO01_13497 [Paraphaeosphaeria sporulosa]
MPFRSGTKTGDLYAAREAIGRARKSRAAILGVGLRETMKASGAVKPADQRGPGKESQMACKASMRELQFADIRGSSEAASRQTRRRGRQVENMTGHVSRCLRRNARQASARVPGAGERLRRCVGHAGIHSINAARRSHASRARQPAQTSPASRGWRTTSGLAVAGQLRVRAQLGWNGEEKTLALAKASHSTACSAAVTDGAVARAAPRRGIPSDMVHHGQ